MTTIARWWPLWRRGARGDIAVQNDASHRETVRYLSFGVVSHREIVNFDRSMSFQIETVKISLFCPTMRGEQ